jgi:prepilin-type N-terminal cleavage/methylation domain-containing protein
MKVGTSTHSGFTLVEIMIVVAILGLLAAIAIPNFVRARSTSRKQACINNLRQIDSGKQQWALENKKSDTDTPASDNVLLYIRNEKFPACPAGGTYTVGAVNTDPKCSESAFGHMLIAP